MRWGVPPDEANVQALTLLLESHDSLIVCEDVEEDRLISVIDTAAMRLRLPVLAWRAHVGLTPADSDRPADKSDDPLECLALIERANRPSLYHLRGFDEPLRDARVVSRLKDVCRKLLQHHGALIVSGASIELPRDLESFATHLRLPPPSLTEYRQIIHGVINELRMRREVQVELDADDTRDLYEHLRGLSLADTRRIVARGIVRDGKLNADDIEEIRQAKREILERTGVLSYVASPTDLSQVAGLATFKEWIRTRSRAFQEPDAAKAFGLTPARGVLLIGVQGCGKSLAAKAVAGEWRLPIVRLDPANLFSKYIGETEKTLRRTLATIESMAPLVVWIDELEKAFASSRENDGGVSARLMGSLLAWLQEHRARVFVVATANDVAALPPELLRKGRFDELFFVDLPDPHARSELFRIHLASRGRIVDEGTVREVVLATEGWSGAEIEQAVIAALHAAFSANVELGAEHLLAESRATTPLSVTMAERIGALRAWADGRAVRADGG
ncbi:MAG: AAA family ATPase [Labilithrix sp.]|nr:AAA family ATPase [Labilithrix sp.]MCW5814218.1 AAA family ATPase [Labilithrix sp.]